MPLHKIIITPKSYIDDSFLISVYWNLHCSINWTQG